MPLRFFTTPSYSSTGAPPSAIKPSDFGAGVTSIKSIGAALTQFTLEYDKADNHFVKSIALSSEILGTTPTIKWSHMLIDDSYNKSTASVQFVVLAEVNATSSAEVDATSTAEFPLCRREVSSSQQVDLLSAPYAALAMLSGFNVSFATEHKLHSFQAWASSSPVFDNAIVLAGQSRVDDSSANSGTGNVQVAVLPVLSPQPRLEIRTFDLALDGGNGSIAGHATFDTAPREGRVFGALQGFRFTYGARTDQAIHRIEVKIQSVDVTGRDNQARYFVSGILSRDHNTTPMRGRVQFAIVSILD